MFSNFKDAFIRKPQYTADPPQAVLDAISQDLPEGFKYVYDHDGICRLDSETGFNLSSGKIVLTEEERFILKDVQSANDILQYAYNAQQEIKIQPNDDGCYIVNDVSVKASDFFRIPMRNVTTGEVELRLVPPAFPEAFPLILSYKGHIVTLQVQRQPNKSLTENKFASIGDDALKISYTIDVVNHKFMFTISILSENAKSVQEIVRSNYIFNAFIDGEGQLGGARIDAKPDTGISRVSKDTIAFWDKVLELEKVIGLNFIIPNDISIDEANKIEELYQSLIKKEPFRTYQTFHSVSGGAHSHMSKPEDEIIGTEIYFEFSENEEIEILGANLSYWGIVGIFGATVTKIDIAPEDSNGKFIIELTPTEGKKMYSSTIYFITQEEMNHYRGKKEHTQMLETARELNLLE